MKTGTDMKTPLKRVRGLGASGSGTEHFWHQRVSAIFLVPLGLYMVWFVMAHLGATRAEVAASLSHPFHAVLMALGVGLAIWHSMLGLQVVIEDYVHGPVAKLAALLLNQAYAALLAGLALYALVKMSFGV